ncbi:MAG: ComF family protein [Solobacterium sp.]|nr:ComF family protein [Solobacterium sp.]
MRCLMCGKRMEESGWITDALFRDDPLCRACRDTWQRYEGRREVNGIRVHSLYRYSGGFRTALLQYKECGDEALRDVFLFQDVRKLRLKYHGYTLVLMPSTEHKRRQRGFDHLEGMFACLKLPCISPFEKTVQTDQKLISRLQRRNMEHSIILKSGITLPKKILLADDVITTGSTLKGALAAIRAEEHQIRILTAAVA